MQSSQKSKFSVFSQSSWRTSKQTFSAALLLFLLNACGGGGGGSESAGSSAPLISGSQSSSQPITPPVSSIPTSPVSVSSAVVTEGAPWSDPTTWGGQMPPSGASIIIPKGKTVVLDRTVEVANLEINGVLAFAAKDIELRAANILVNGGMLQIGTEESPFANKAMVTLTGNPADQNASLNDCGIKYLCVKGGGKLELHGSSRDAVSWTKINGTLQAGATSMQLVSPVRWTAGSELALAPTGYDNGQHERLTVTSISADGLNISFTPALKYEHFGVVQTIEGKAIDQRAEVGLLTRNIIVRSDPNTVKPFSTLGKQANLYLPSELAADPKDRFGGHVMVMDGVAHIEGVTFKDLGQATHLGRYAFHWHKTGEGNGQYIKNSTVDSSYTRGIVAHDTNNVLVERNVVYNSISHNFIFSESGSESGNVFKGNFALGTYQFPDKHRISVRAATSSNDFDARRAQDENRPSQYWGLGHNNILLDNVAAGGEGQGFFFAGGNQSELSKFQFIGNVAHSAFSGTGGNDLYPPDSRGHGLFVTAAEGTPMNPKAFLSYKNSMSGAWLESPLVTLSDAILADNNAGVIAFQGRLENSLIVGQSANTNGTPSTIQSQLSGGIHLGPGDQGAPKIAKVSNVTFVNQRDAAIVAADHFIPVSGYTEKIKLVNTKPLQLRGAIPGGTMGGFVDRDGSLSGTGQPSLILGSRSLQADATCTLKTEWSVYICPASHINRVMMFQIADAWIPGSTLARREMWNIGASRDDGVNGKMYIEGISGGRPALVLKSHHYDLDFSEIGNPGTNPGPYAKAKIMWSDNSYAGLPEDANNWITVSIPVESAQAWAYPLELKQVGNERNVQFPVYDKPLKLVASRADLANSVGSAWWFDASAKKAYVKVTSGSGPVYVCETQDCK